MLAGVGVVSIPTDVTWSMENAAYWKANIFIVIFFTIEESASRIHNQIIIYFLRPYVPDFGNWFRQETIEIE